MTCFRKGVLFIFVLLFLFHFSHLHTNEIHINDGAIRGTVISAFNGRPIFSYMGIPYAEKPARFKPSVPKKPWDGILNATQDGPMCVQRDRFHPFPLKVIGQEDCLYLSAYTPLTPKECQDTEKKIPVMVWIFGGRWISGSNEEVFYGPEFMLMKDDVVLVTISYRLDVFGFLATNDKTAAGNWGLHDQALALKWVKQNIQFFGGDPNKVTLFGQSVGGVSTHLHCFSDLWKGLFHGMISQSGTAYAAPFGVHLAERVANVTKELAEACECPTNSSIEMVKCLRRVPADQLIKNQATIYGVKDGYPAFELGVWTPVYDTPFTNKPFFRCNPNNPNCSECSLPWISGINKYEGSLYACEIYQNPGLEALVEKYPYPYLSTFIQLDAIFPKETAPTIMEKIMRFYFHGQPISRNSQGLVDLYTDFHFYWPAVRALFKHPGHGYFYLYDYVTPEENSNIFYECASNSKLPRPTHYDDCLTLFKLGLNNRTYTKTDLDVIKYHVGLWTKFAKTQDATYGRDNGKWDKVRTIKNFKYLAFGKKPEMKEGLPFTERYNFWEDIAQEYSSSRFELRV